MKEVPCKLYDIEMTTPIGQRRGILSVCKEEMKLYGQLTILHHTEPYEGTIDGNGNCCFSGKIVTLMRTIFYVATGKISDEAVALELAAECGSYKEIFKITGRSSRK